MQRTISAFIVLGGERVLSLATMLHSSPCINRFVYLHEPTTFQVALEAGKKAANAHTGQAEWFCPRRSLKQVAGHQVGWAECRFLLPSP